MPLHFTAPTPGTVTLHRASGIVSTCLFGTMNGEWATGRVEGLEFDTFLLTRGSNRPWDGVLDGEPFHIEPHGTLLITYIPQGVAGEMTFYAEANTSSLLMFPPGRIANMMPGDGAAARQPFAMLANDRLIELFQMIETEVITCADAHDGHIETLTRLLAHYLAGLPEHLSGHQSGHLDISPHKLKRVLDYIDEHLGKPIDINAMAKVAGLSRFYFVHVFKKATGRSPYQHLLYRRVARAQTLIAAGSQGLREIGEASGFTSPAQFSSSFRRETGMSPTRYRDLVRLGVEVPSKEIPVS